MSNWRLLEGDCLVVLKTMADQSVDAVVTDPPAGIGFMGREWDDFRRARNPADVGRDDQFGRLSARGPQYGRSERQAFIEFIQAVMQECWRVLRPGGHALVWAIPRTAHWTATAVEDAGFDIRDVVVHLFGTGFPKSLDIAKAIDRAGGRPVFDQAAELRIKREAAGLSRAELADRIGCTEASVRDWEEGRARAVDRPVEWIVPSPEYRDKLRQAIGYSDDERVAVGQGQDRREDGSVIGLGHSGRLLSGGHTDEAARWSGWGTALKPAAEHWILARRPVDGTIAENVMRHGTGAINVDGCRVGSEKRTYKGSGVSQQRYSGGRAGLTDGRGKDLEFSAAGRWPANVVLSHHPDCRLVGVRQIKPLDGPRKTPVQQQADGRIQFNQKSVGFQKVGYTDESGFETVEKWECVEDCPVAELDRQSGVSQSRIGQARSSAQPGDGWGMTKTGAEYDDLGGASRFFYTAKATRDEREAGLDGLPVKTGAQAVDREAGTAGLNSPRAGAGRTAVGVHNHHPTVKSVDLMRYLCRLITPPGGLVLDPFAGSGSTGLAALLEGFSFIGIEREAEYVEIAKARLTHWERYGEQATLVDSAGQSRKGGALPVDMTTVSLFDEEEGGSE